MEKRYRILLFFILGFLLGIGIVTVGADKIPGLDGLLGAADISQMQYLKIDRTALFWYSLKRRVGMALFLIVAAIAGMGIAAVIFSMIWCGVSAGLLMTLLSLRYGIRGILLFLAAGVPQMLVYIPAFLLLIWWCMGFHEKYKPPVLLAVVIIGCALESYVNPSLLHFILNIF